MHRRHRVRAACLVGVFATLMGALVRPAGAQGTPPDSGNVTRVVLNARFDARTHSVAGSVTYAFVNTSDAPLTELVFHRYLEAFRDDRSVFMRESHGQLRGVDVEGTGGTELRSLRVDGGELLSRIERELEPGDFTQFRVALLDPIAPGATVGIRVEFVSRLPRLAARAGYVGDFNLLTQWFPKLAKLADDGTWVSFPYHGNGEFFADFATYDVTLDAPSAFSVEGTGTRVSHRVAHGRVVDHFVAERVHDAAYAIARDFTTIERTCHRVRVRVVHPPGYASAAAEHLDATCFGLDFFGRRLGTYPYPGITVVVPPEGADGGAGMEYPQAFITDGPWYPSRFMPFSSALETTFHELGHQWFQGLVASNEDEHPLLDEGLTNFIGYEALAAYTGRADPTHVDYWRTYVTDDDALPPGLASSSYDSGQYGTSVYGRSVLILESLARTYGRASVWAALGAYARAWRWRHPEPRDLVQSFSDSFARTEGPRFGERVVAPLLLAGQRIVLHADYERGELVATREGTLDVPVDVEFRVDDLVRRRRWRGTNALRFRVPEGAHACLVLDPHSKLLLEPDRRDDTSCVRTRPSRLASMLRILVAAVLRGGAP